ncbi:MAG: DISARM system helicase DrmA [Deltaproteobacteria bacterium]|nr:DISARM system helicase DrmA [Deltaproteobacteria bacterium]
MTVVGDVRAALVSALAADLVGPFEGPEESLSVAPSRWYLTGFLASHADREVVDPEADDELTSGREEDPEEIPASQPDAKQRHYFPASMGMSMLLPAAPVDSQADTLEVTVRFATYTRVETPDSESPKRRDVTWKRTAFASSPMLISLSPTPPATEHFVPEAPGISLDVRIDRADAPGLAQGTRALSIFVINGRPTSDKSRLDESYIFQVDLHVKYAQGFVPRPSRQGEAGDSLDDRTADLQYRDAPEWGVGHNVSVVHPATSPGSHHVTELHTTWIPCSEVHRVETHTEPSVVTNMESLAALTDPLALTRALSPIVDAYSTWIEAQREIALDSEAREHTRNKLLKNAKFACKRIEAGIAMLAHDPTAREAFADCNRVMAQAARQRSPGRYSATVAPTWRLFQLAFVLMSLPGIVDETHADRETVELIFFPTGGGKTEAYLGVIAFALVLRRLRGLTRPDQGLGVAVILRYTLRLLTLDQLGRAATLICALELLRQEQPHRLGTVRFAVGLWVGRASTDNTLDQAQASISDFVRGRSTNSPFPLTHCPWCNSELGPKSLFLADIEGKEQEVRVYCTPPTTAQRSSCKFSDRNNPDGLPVLFVDEQIYRELPAFLIGTVDKFAMLPWRGSTGMLFGRATAHLGRQFFGPMDARTPKSAKPLHDGLRPPELIVQDELHLISGPLGTMVGLFETAVEYLCQRTQGERTIRPKIIASTATVRRAQAQIRALFGRSDTALFPPPGVNANETYFAAPVRDKPGRLYVGVAAPGRALKAVLLRTYVPLLGAAQAQYQRQLSTENPDNPSDPYMTLAGYFNSLRELGGMRRLVEDEVLQRVSKIEQRRPESAIGPHPWARNRTLSPPAELTSREKSQQIKETKERLSRAHSQPQHVDVLLASNMISVGVDIDRLGLMVIAGQPKTASEYIQASSRVGRQHPGLVVTCFNAQRPRDRSHFERFAAWHQSFYRHVEATSLTPFSGPAMDRGLAGLLVAMTRLSDIVMTKPSAAMELEAHREIALRAVHAIAERAGRHSQTMSRDELDRLAKYLVSRGEKLVDAWLKLIAEVRSDGEKRQYSPMERDPTAGKSLLSTPSREDPPEPNTPEALFVTQTSMRDVEPSVHLWVDRTTLRGES